MLGAGRDRGFDRREKEQTRSEPPDLRDAPWHLRVKAREISRFTKTGDYEAGMKLFKTIEDPNMVLYCAALNLCAKASWLDEARELWATMPSSAKDVVAYSTMINVCARCKAMREAERLFEEMRANGVSPNIVTYNSMVNAYGMTGQPDKAKAIFDGIPSDMLSSASGSNQQVTFLSLMSAYARVGDYAAAREVFTQMTSSGVPPNRNHFNALLTACARDGLAETAQDIFDLMPKYGVPPATDSWTALLSCHRHNLQRCQQIVSQMHASDVTFTGLTYQELLRAHVLAKDGNGARELAKDLGKFGHWKDMTITRSLLKQAAALP